MPKKPTDGHWIGFDLGGTKMLAVLFDGAFNPVARSRKKTKAREGQDTGIARVIKTIDEALKDAGMSRNQLSGIGMGCPGPLDLDKGVILDAPNLGWENVPLKKTLEKEFGCPAVILNDVDAGVYGEYRSGAARKARCVVGAFPGTGLGGGCIYEGRILRGRVGSCMEIGHIRVKAEGDLCGCGRRGCLETVASRLAISGEVAKAAYRGESPLILDMAGMDLSNIRSGVLAKAIEQGDAVVEQIVRNAAYTLGVALGGLVNLLSPDVLLLGGGLVEAMPDLYVEEVKRGTAIGVMPSFEGTYKVVVAGLGDDATVTGAAAWAQELSQSSA